MSNISLKNNNNGNNVNNRNNRNKKNVNNVNINENKNKNKNNNTKKNKSNNKKNISNIVKLHIKQKNINSQEYNNKELSIDEIFNFSGQEQRNKDLRKLFNFLTSMNKNLYTSTFGNNGIPIAQLVTITILSILIDNQDKIVDRQRKLLHFLRKYKEIIDSYSDDAIKIKKLQTLAEMAGWKEAYIEGKIKKNNNKYVPSSPKLALKVEQVESN